MRAVPLTVPALIAVAGCSFGVNRAPKTVSVDSPPRCTSDMVRPGLDFAAAGAAGIAGIASEDGRGAFLAIGATMALVGVIGAAWVNDCRRKTAAYERLELGAGAVADRSTARGGAPDAPDKPSGEAAAAPPAERAAASGPVCDAGASCPAGQRCDPLRGRCVSTDADGTEDRSCRAGGGCDAGLYCDLERRICLPGNLGLEGGPCQARDRCLEGLECRAGLCVRKPQPRLSTPPPARGR